MADDSVVDDDESKIVTKFLLNTCRLLQPTIHHVYAAVFCAFAVTEHPFDDDEVDLTPLTTGSVAEFYIQPMLSFVGDVDVMSHRSDELAIPDGYPPPSRLPAEFHSRVKVYEIIDSEYPGYVYLVRSYLLTENTDDDKYDAVQFTTRRYVLYNTFKRVHDSDLTIEIHGPASTARYTQLNITFDNVHCVRCLSWPTQAADWPTRHRNYGWPDSATVDHVVSSGCDVVRVAHRLYRQDVWMNEPGNYLHPP